jgi:hypothetical protein
MTNICELGVSGVDNVISVFADHMDWFLNKLFSYKEVAAKYFGSERLQILRYVTFFAVIFFSFFFFLSVFYSFSLSHMLALSYLLLVLNLESLNFSLWKAFSARQLISCSIFRKTISCMT